MTIDEIIGGSNYGASVGDGSLLLLREGSPWQKARTGPDRAT